MESQRAHKLSFYLSDNVIAYRTACTCCVEICQNDCRHIHTTHAAGGGEIIVVLFRHAACASTLVGPEEYCESMLGLCSEAQMQTKQLAWSVLSTDSKFGAAWFSSI